MTSLAMVAATLTMSAATVVVTASPSQADVGGSPSAEALALAEAARTGHRVEVTEEDTETETVYANPDGTLTSEVTQVPTRIEQPNGDLVPVDLDLASTDGRLAPKVSPSEVSLSATGGGQLADLALPGAASFGMQLTGGVGAPEVSEGTATYPVSGADPASVQVATSTTGFSAHVLIPSAPGAGDPAPTYTFPLKLDGLHASLSHQQLVLTNDAGETVATSSPLMMWDSRLDAAGDPAQMIPVDADLVSTSDGGTALRLSPSLAYLSDPATVYPVTVDPDIQATLSSDSDTMVSLADPDTEWSSAYKIRVGNSGGSTWRIFERFNIDPYLGDNVESATLKMYQYYGPSCASATTNVYPTAEFGGGPLTWSTQPAAKTSANWSSSFATNNAGGSTCPTAFDSIDVTKLMDGFTTGALDSGKAGTGDAQGTDDSKTHVATIELRAADESGTTGDKRFCSMNFSAGDAYCNTSARQPTLSLTYSPDLGEKSFYSTTDHDLNDRTTLKINNDDGNALVKADDVQIRSLGQDLAISRYYNSLSDEVGAFGPGWSMSVGPDVRLVNRGSNRFDYVSPSGAVYAGFVRKTTLQSDPDYRNFTTPHGGVGATLHDQADGTFTLTFHQSQKVYTFKQVDPSSSDYYLTRSADRTAAADDLDGTDGKPNQALTYNYAAGTHQLASVTDASGHTVTVHYNTSGFVDTITDANGPTTRTWGYAYTGGRLSTYTDPAGKHTDYTYTSTGTPQLATIVDPVNAAAGSLHPKVTLGYQANQATSVAYSADGSGATVGYSFAYYDSQADAGRCKPGDSDYTDVTSTDPQQGRVTYCFRRRGAAGDQMTHRVVDGLDHRRSTNYTLDAQPSAFTGGTNDGGEGTDTGSTVATYGAGNEEADRLDKVTDPKDAPTNTASATSLTYNTSSSSTGYRYLPSTKTDANGVCTAYQYDNQGRLTDSYLDGNGPCEDANGVDTTGRHYKQYFNNNTALDAANNTGPDGTVRYSYDPNGSSTSSERTSYTYWQSTDAGYVTGTNGMVKTVTKPGGTCTGTRTLCTSYTYDGLARISTVTDGRGKVTTYKYDDLDRTTQVLLDGTSTCSTGAGTCIKYTYDAEGNMTSRVDPQGTTTFGYNRLNRQISVATPDASVVTYGYNDDGKLTQLGVSVAGGTTHTVTYGYDAADQPASASDPALAGGTPIALGHDNDNRDNKVTFPTTNPVSITRSYTNAGRPDKITLTRAGTPTEDLPDWQYNYTKSGQDTDEVQKITVSGSSSAVNQVVAYSYVGGDGLLTDADADTGTDYHYTYDPAVNLTSEKIGSTTTYYGYDRAGQLCWQGTTDPTTVGATALSDTCPSSPPGTNTKVNRDTAGNDLGTTTVPLTYNADNQVATIAGRTQGYLDQGNDLRVSTGSTTSGAGLVNSSVGVLARTTTAGTTYYLRSPSGTILAEYGAGGTYYYATNNQHSITTLIDTDGNRVAYYRYTPYGDPTIVEATAMTAATNNPWRYTGGYYDIEGDGYTHLGARYYDNHSHFNQPDPRQGTLNNPLSLLTYGYAGGDPMNNTDREGQSLDDVGLALAQAWLAAGGSDIAAAGAEATFATLGGELAGTTATVALAGVAAASLLFFGIGLIAAAAILPTVLD